MVRPWKLPFMQTTIGESMFFSLAYSRVILMAASLASAPELPKNTFSIPEIRQRASLSLA